MKQCLWEKQHITLLIYISNYLEHLTDVSLLIHWGWVTYVGVSKLTIIGSDNGLSPGQHQAIILTKAGILLIGPLGTIFSKISIKTHIFSFKKIHLKMSSGNWDPFCLSLNVLISIIWIPSFKNREMFFSSSSHEKFEPNMNHLCDTKSMKILILTSGPPS